MSGQQLKGTVEKITYINRENGYTVFKLKSGRERITCVGTVPVINEGDIITVTGTYGNHSVYGEQFIIETIDVSAPKTQLQILKFLSSGAIKGVGPSTAVKIVERFKSETLNIIENYPMELTTIKGISADRAMAICEEYKKQFGIRDIMISLSEFNITPVEAAHIFKSFGINSIDLIKENPFILCNDEIGFRFERAEEISDMLGLPRDSEGRVCAGIEYILRRNLNNGHTCLPLYKLLSVAENLLNINEILLRDSIKNLQENMKIVIKVYDGEEYVFIFEYYEAEKFIASKIKSYVNNNLPLYPITAEEIDIIERKLGFGFEEKQLEAVNAALENNIFILTGGPGTGKTTTLNALIYILQTRGNKIALAAPTGRAAKRITELTGCEAKTLHRLLEVEWGEGDKQSFSRNRKNPLDEDVIIIDEMSMVDTMLFKAFLEAVRTSSRIILVGDSEQLPSVGAGNILGDLISSDNLPFVKLSKIFRQTEAGDIVKNAHGIIEGKMPNLKNRSGDFFFIRSTNPELCSKTVVDLVRERLPKAYGFSPVDDIQVLCPSKKLACGSYNLNLSLQEALNPETNVKKQLFYKGISYRVGDKVMQIKNDYDIIWSNDSGETGTGIFNGDMGKIIDIDTKNRTLSVSFDDKVATYFEDDLEILELAYAVTVHKSQGSEFDAVIIPVSDTPKLLRYRNLIYTAVTRAKKLLILVGDEKILNEMIENDRKTLRYTGLGEMLNYD